MTFPAVQAVGGDVLANGTSDTPLNMPSGVAVGDTLILRLQSNPVSPWPTPSGWTPIFTTVTSNNNHFQAFARIATGSGDAPTIVRAGNGGSGVYQVYRINGTANGTLADVVGAQSGGGFDTYPDPPSLTTGWGSVDALWLAFGNLNDINGTVAPTNYTNLVTQGDGGWLFPMASARRSLAAASEDPGAFSATSGRPLYPVGATIAVRGTAPAGPVITGPATFNLAENDTTSGPLFSTDIGLGAGFPTKGGADAALFNLVSVGANQWRFVKITGGNFEAPDDAGANRVYDLVFNASASVSAPSAITLTNVVELPGAPTIGTATAGNATVTITGTAPAPNGGPSVTGYQATLSPGAITKTGATLPITFTGADGVANGTTYTGTLRAINSDGTGPASASSNPVTPSLGATATALTLTPATPASGPVGVASGVFTVGVNGTLGAGVTRVATPSAGAGGGSFSPASVSLTDAQPTGTFVYTPASEGSKSITLTNDGSLSNPAAVSYTATAAAPPPPPPPPTGTAVLSAVATDATGSGDYLNAPTRVIAEPFTSIEALGTGARTITTATTHPSTGQVTLTGMAPGTYAVFQFFPATGATITGAAFDIVTVT